VGAVRARCDGPAYYLCRSHASARPGHRPTDGAGDAAGPAAVDLDTAIRDVLAHLPEGIGSWQSTGMIAVRVRELAALRDAANALRCRSCDHVSYTHSDDPGRPPCSVMGCNCKGMVR
jgi:hypothetical protein